MIKHIVMWNLRGDAPQDKARSIEQVKNAFESLQGKIPGMTQERMAWPSSNTVQAPHWAMPQPYLALFRPKSLRST